VVHFVVALDYFVEDHQSKLPIVSLNLFQRYYFREHVKITKVKQEVSHFVVVGQSRCHVFL